MLCFATRTFTWKSGFYTFPYCSVQPSHPYRVVGWWLTVQKKKKELPPGPKTDSGLSSLRHPQNTNEESQTLEVRERVNHSRDRLSVEDQISLKNSAAGRRGPSSCQGQRRDALMNQMNSAKAWK